MGNRKAAVLSFALSVILILAGNSGIAAYRLGNEKDIINQGEAYRESFKKPYIIEIEETEVEDDSVKNPVETDTGLIAKIGNLLSGVFSGIRDLTKNFLDPLLRAINTWAHRESINSLLNTVENQSADSQFRKGAIEMLGDFLSEPPGITAGMQQDAIDLLISIVENTEENYEIRERAFNELKEAGNSNYVSFYNRNRIAEVVMPENENIWLSQWNDVAHIASIEQGESLGVEAFRSGYVSIISETDDHLRIEVPENIEFEYGQESIILSNAQTHIRGPADINDEFCYSVYFSGKLETDEDQAAGTYRADVPLRVTDSEGNVDEFKAALITEVKKSPVRISSYNDVFDIFPVERGSGREIGKGQTFIDIITENEDVEIAASAGTLEMFSGSDRLTIIDVEMKKGNVARCYEHGYVVQGILLGEVQEEDLKPGLYTGDVPLVITDSRGDIRQYKVESKIEIQESGKYGLRPDYLELGSGEQGGTFQMNWGRPIGFPQGETSQWHAPDFVEVTNKDGENMDVKIDIEMMRLDNDSAYFHYGEIYAGADIHDFQQPGRYEGTVPVSFTDRFGEFYEKKIEISVVVEEAIKAPMRVVN